MTEENEIQAQGEAPAESPVADADFPQFHKLTVEQAVKLHIYENFVHPEYEPEPERLVRAMDIIFKWVMHDRVPKRPRLNLVKSGEDNED